MHEVDFWRVSLSSKSADAITMRFADPSTGRNVVAVIDGGFAKFGEELAANISTYYGTNKIDLVISTHPDSDHINGLTHLIENMEVKEILIHRPKSRGFSGDVVGSDVVEDLIATAVSNGTTVNEPKLGLQRFGGAITIVGPSEEFYREMLQAQVDGSSTTSSISPLQEMIRKAQQLEKAVVSKIRQVLTGDPGETLTNNEGDTSPRNNSSVVTLFRSGSAEFLFTGDAGVPALQMVVSALKITRQSTVTPIRPGYVQVPHHGSRHNVSVDLLDQLLGPPSDKYSDGRWAIVSASDQDEKHPHPKVLNAFKRRGYGVVTTEETSFVNVNNGFPGRSGVIQMEALPWYEEGDDD